MSTTIPTFTPGGSSPLERVITILPSDHQVRKRVESIFADEAALDTKTVAGQAAIGQSMRNRAYERDNIAALVRGEAGSAAITGQRAAERRANVAVDAVHAETRKVIAAHAAAVDLVNRIPAVIAPFLIPANTVNDKNGALIRVDTLKDIPLAAPARLPGDLTVEDAVELGDQYRTEFGVLSVEKAEIESAAPDFEFAKRELLRSLDDLAESAELRVQKVGPFAGRLLWPQTNVNAAPLTAGFKPRVTDVNALLVRHMRPLIEAEALAALEQFYRETPLALTAEAKRKALKDVRAKIARAEGLEVAAIWKARELGAEFSFRPDTNVRTLLGIAA